MNSNSLSRHHHSSQPFKRFPLQTSNKHSQEYTIVTQPHKDKSVNKSSHPSHQLSISSKTKSIRHQSSKENLPDSRATTISTTSKIPEEKGDSLSIPSRSIKTTKPGHSTEKSFQDLNKSLANLALKRWIVRSSSDNESIGRLNHTETDLQNSYGPSHHHAESQYTYNSISATPFSSKRATQNFQNFQSSQTSVQKATEVTPFSFVNQITRESVKAQGPHINRQASSKDLTLSDLGYGKLQNNTHKKSARPSQNTHYLPIDTRARSQARNLVTEGSYQMEFSNIDNLDNTDSRTLSQCLSKEMQLSYLNGEYFHEIQTENLEDDEFEHTLETVRQLSAKEEQDSGSMVSQKKPCVQNYRNTPSFKGKDRIKKNGNNLGNNPRRFSDMASVPRVSERRVDRNIGIQRKNNDRLELNHISDGVEYTMGGVGMNNQLKEKQKVDACNRTTVTEVSQTNSNLEAKDNIRRQTLDIWKNDLMNIKKEMEIRKKSYAEVTKFMKMHDKNTVAPPQPRETRENSFDMYATRKTANMSSLNASKFEKIETMRPYSSGLKALNENLRDARRQSRKKISLELRTVEDYNDQKSTLSALRVRTAPYCDSNNDTNELNTFMYDDNFIFEQAQRQACCGPEKMCNIF